VEGWGGGSSARRGCGEGGGPGRVAATLTSALTSAPTTPPPPRRHTRRHTRRHPAAAFFLIRQVEEKRLERAGEISTGQCAQVTHLQRELKRFKEEEKACAELVRAEITVPVVSRRGLLMISARFTYDGGRFSSQVRADEEQERRRKAADDQRQKGVTMDAPKGETAIINKPTVGYASRSQLTYDLGEADLGRRAVFLMLAPVGTSATSTSRCSRLDGSPVSCAR